MSFDVPARTVTALAGPSGSGKFTITNLIARFFDVDSGAVTIGGTDIRRLTESDLMSLVTTVYRDVYLFADTVRANLTIGRPDATSTQIRDALIAAHRIDVA